nr:hypothetical protein [Tanacetum cinerariifolium]
MLCVFPITLTGATKRWVDRLPPGTVDSWDLLKKSFIQRYCPPSKNAKQLKEICNFKQEGDETYIKIRNGIMTFYTNAPPMTSITIRRNIKSSSNSEGITAIVNKLENFDRDIEKLKENVHAIQVGCQTYEGDHLDKDCPLNEEVKGMEEVKYREFRTKKAIAALEAKLKKKIEQPKKVKQNVNYYVDPYEPLIPFHKRLEHHAEEALITGEKDSKMKKRIEEYLENPEECEEDKANTILGVIHEKLNIDWFNNTSEDEDDLEGILDYLKPRSYDGFINLDDEASNKRRCRLLGMTYKEPTSILIEKAKVTRYTVGPGETYTKVKLLGVEKIPRTKDNVAAIKARLMKKMAQEGNNQAKT